jgi:G6PDH family F420-dependent oxidoreductase
MQATSLPFGTLCVPGGWRYHPAIVAQAAATLERLFPGRLRWIAAGSGEALNEAIVGARWPDKAVRNERLRAGVDIVRRLWAGETVSADAPIACEKATLYTRPERPPRILVPALTPETAAWAAGWADGLVTVAMAPDRLRRIVAAFREGGGAGKPLALQVHLSWAESDAAARANAYDQWRTNAVAAEQVENLRTPEAFEAATAHIHPEDMDMHVRISADPARHADWLAADVAIGFDEIHLHNVGRNQRAFIDAFGARVLPELRREEAA